METIIVFLTVLSLIAGFLCPVWIVVKYQLYWKSSNEEAIEGLFKYIAITISAWVWLISALVTM